MINLSKNITTAYKVTHFTQELAAKTHPSHTTLTVESMRLAAKAFGQLVVLGFDVTVFTPAPYQRRSLRRPSYGALILWPASHLDAFSAYPIPTRIPGGAPGGTTGKPEVSQTRSSRTSVSTTQDSCAHDR